MFFLPQMLYLTGSDRHQIKHKVLSLRIGQRMETSLRDCFFSQYLSQKSIRPFDRVLCFSWLETCWSYPHNSLGCVPVCQFGNGFLSEKSCCSCQTILFFILMIYFSLLVLMLVLISLGCLSHFQINSL